VNTSLADTHQFMSTDVQFMLNDPRFTLINSNLIGTYAYEDFKTVKFSLLHAKNIRNDFGVPIWFSTHDKAHQPVPFIHFIYTWSKHSMRLDTDPFLSFRVRGHFFCLLYSHIQTAVKSSATHFGLSATWFNTIARAANLSVPNIMHMGRWKSLPAPILYQAQSTALNDHILSVINNPTLFTSDDILLSRVLASRP